MKRRQRKRVQLSSTELLRLLENPDEEDSHNFRVLFDAEWRALYSHIR